MSVGEQFEAKSAGIFLTWGKTAAAKEKDEW